MACSKEAHYAAASKANDPLRVLKVRQRQRREHRPIRFKGKRPAEGIESFGAGGGAAHHEWASKANDPLRVLKGADRARRDRCTGRASEETGKLEPVKLYADDYQFLRENGHEHSDHDLYAHIRETVQELDRQDALTPAHEQTQSQDQELGH